jgi:uncharacterized membrane protein YhaH (DUF805 family)
MDPTTTVQIVTGIVAVLILPLTVIPYWKIFDKAGFSGWLSLTQLVPLVGLAVLYYVAFSEWKWKPRIEKGASTQV